MRWELAITSLAVAGCGGSAPPDDDGPAWYEGSFRALPAGGVDLVDLVGELEHPTDRYVPLSADRAAAVDALAGTMLLAIDQGADGDWCEVLDRAAAAGYGVSRIQDLATGRWLVFGEDLTDDGQAYFVANPQARRDLVVEVPHEPYDTGTAVEGARIFREVSARALILNGADRCADPDPSPCDGTTDACGGAFRESDVAHHTASAFHRLHVRYSDRGPDTRFVQLHGFDGDEDDRAEIGDGGLADLDSGSVAASFALNLSGLAPSPVGIHGCQLVAGDPPSALCGETNVQGRHSAAPEGDACLEGVAAGSTRFLHVEQDATLRDDDPSDGWSWELIRDALLQTWPSCGFGGDCEPGPAHPELLDYCVCGESCPGGGGRSSSWPGAAPGPPRRSAARRAGSRSCRR